MSSLKSILTITAFCFCSISVAKEKSYYGPMSRHAEEGGIKTCLAAIKIVDKFLYDREEVNGVNSTWHNENPDSRGFNASGAIKNSDGTWALQVVHLSPTKGNTCDGIATRITTYPNQSCASVREELYKDWSYKGEIAGKALYGNKNQDLFLEDLTGSCIAVRTEDLYNL